MVSGNELTPTESERRPLKPRLAIDASVGGADISEVEHEIETIVSWYSGRFGSSDFVTFKELYFQNFGKVFPEDEYFNQRMSYFIDQFVFEFQMPALESQIEENTPFEQFLLVNPNTAFRSAKHSIFSVQRVQPQYLLIRDLLSKERHRIEIHHGASFAGIQKKDLFQGFLYELREGISLSRGLIFHPTNVHSLIKKELKNLLNNGNLNRLNLLARLAHQQLRHLRHLHVNARIFYNTKAKGYREAPTS